MPFIHALGISAALAIAAWLLRSLTRSGAVAATAVGVAIVWPTGWPGFVVLGVYFVTSTLVSRLSSAARGKSDQSDTETRDHRQVIANGGWAAVGGLLEFAIPGCGLWIATVALAASGGDTWATAVGSLSPRPPRDILTRKLVRPGTSGGVTWFGSSGGLMGSALIGLTGTMMTRLPELFLVAGLTGQLAMVLDSILGSSVQARFACPQCNVVTERPVHRCGTTTNLMRGSRWMDNDAVNALASGGAFLVGLVTCWALFSSRA